MTTHRAFEYRHVVGFEETNLVGNVYYVNHLRWQGRCRELFLRRYCPPILERLGHDLVLSTTRCSCEYFAELQAFDEIVVRMRLGAIAQNRITMLFEYYRDEAGSETLAARGEQQVACMERGTGGITPTAVPEELAAALERFAS